MMSSNIFYFYWHFTEPLCFVYHISKKDIRKISTIHSQAEQYHEKLQILFQKYQRLQNPTLVFVINTTYNEILTRRTKNLALHRIYVRYYKNEICFTICTNFTSPHGFVRQKYHTKIIWQFHDIHYSLIYKYWKRHSASTSKTILFYFFVDVPKTSSYNAQLIFTNKKH